MTVESVTIDLSTWTRRAEVEKYAQEEGITISHAIHRLVNAGLSHL